MSIAIAEIFSGVLFIVIAVWFYSKSLGFPTGGNASDVGPALFPQLTSVAMVIFALILIGMGVKRRIQKNDKPIVFHRGLAVAGAMVMLVVYLSVMPIIGYYLATLFFVPFMLVFAGIRQWKPLVFCTLGFILFAYAGFDLLLNVPLP